MAGVVTPLLTVEQVVSQAALPPPLPRQPARPLPDLMVDVGKISAVQRVKQEDLTVDAVRPTATVAQRLTSEYCFVLKSRN